MPTEHVRGKPQVGTYVHYYDPHLMQKIGMTEGAGQRYDGPYAALVTNNLGDGCVLTVFMPGWAAVEKAGVPHKDKAPAFVAHDGTNHPAQNGNGYWDWQSQTQAMRAAKEVKDAEADHGSASSQAA